MHIICVSFHSLLRRGSSVMLEVWVALSVLFMHNSVMFSDSSKGPQTAVSWNLGLLGRPWAFQKL